MKNRFINKRKKNYFNKKKFIFFFTIFFLSFIYLLFLDNSKFINSSKKYIEEYSLKFDYNLQSIEISGLSYLDRDEILNFFTPYKDKSIFLIPFKKISREINSNKWVKDIRIKSNYKNSLQIIIEEEIPFGIYDNGNQKLLFSSDLIILEIIQNKKKYLNLITFYGKNSIIMSKNFVLNFDNVFYEMIDSAIYIEKRRWNILLKNGVILFLPEKEISEAIKYYKKIYANFSNKDLKEIKSIDLRLTKRATIKYKDLND